MPMFPCFYLEISNLPYQPNYSESPLQKSLVYMDVGQNRRPREPQMLV